MQENVLRLVHERLADATDASVWWPLCVMRAAQTDNNLESLLSVAPKEDWGAISAAHQAIFGRLKMADWEAEAVRTRMENPSPLAITSPLIVLKDKVFAAARNLAEKRAPRHPWVRRLVAARDKEMERIDASTALMQMEVAIREGGIQDAWTLTELMRLRFEVLGLTEAFQRPLPPIHNAMAFYGLAQALPDILEKDFVMERAVLDAEEQKTLTRLLRDMRYALHEQGLARMDQCFRTGKGHPHEGNAHLYSLLCNGLAALCRADARHAEAIALYRRGIDASPLAEHYQGILDCCWSLDDNAGIVEAAEQLWHYATRCGYAHHDPNKYASRVAKALYRLNRSKEIVVWLKRLLVWQRKNGASRAKEKAEKHLSNEFLRARLEVACYMFHSHADTCMALWRRIKTQVDASDDVMVHAAAGDLMHGCKQYAEAGLHYERALALNRELGDGGDATLESAIRKRLEDYRARAEAEARADDKPWWRLW
jgi:tetratricopeptide (TPR) repeat protein